jgi:hypothetical protein
MVKKPVADQDRWQQGAVPLEYMIFFTQMVSNLIENTFKNLKLTIKRYLDHSFDNIRRCSDYKRFQFLQYDQRY